MAAIPTNPALDLSAVAGGLDPALGHALDSGVAAAALGGAHGQGEADAVTGLSGLPEHELLSHEERRVPHAGRHRIVLIRHGQPHIALRPRTKRDGFARYMDQYEEAGLHPDSDPPAELRALLAELAPSLRQVFASNRPRAFESAARLLPHLPRVIEPEFAEAPLPAPPLPGVTLRVAKWAVLARIFWHAGYHPGIENPAEARARAQDAATRLMEQARDSGAAVLVAHGYFNYMIGRALRAHGFSRTGSHRATFWNCVVYDKG